MKINSIGYNPVQTRQQVGFGMSALKLTDDIAQRARVSNCMGKIEKLAKKLAKDGKDLAYTVFIGGCKNEKILTSVQSGDKVIGVIEPMLKGNIITGFENIPGKIRNMLQQAKKLVKAK